MIMKEIFSIYCILLFVHVLVKIQLLGKEDVLQHPLFLMSVLVKKSSLLLKIN